MAIPVPQTATVNGATLTVTYNVAVDPTAVLSPSLFSVNVGNGSGGPVNVVSATVDALDHTKVVLTLNRTVGNGQFLTLTYNDPTDGVDDPNVVQDAAFPADDAVDFTIIVANNTPDTAPPTVNVSLDDASLIAGQTALVTFTFSEAPTGFTAADISTTNGTLSGLAATGNARVYTATLTPGANGSGTVAVANLSYTDAAGNAGSGGSATFIADLVPPTVVVTANDTTLDPGETATLTFTFSEAPAGFTAADVTATNGAVVSGLAATADPLIWTATLTPAAAGTIVVGVTSLSYTDQLGNPGSGDTQTLTVGAPVPPTPTEGDDVIQVPPGAGLVSALGGDDLVYGSDLGDYLQGNGGADTLYGGAGNDTLLGGQGNDLVQGNSGDDVVFGDLGADRVYGGQGNDFVHGNAGNDSVFGDLGNDTVRGGQGDDLVVGGDGADYLFGDLGWDTLVGGAGADRFYFPTGADGSDRITDFSRVDGDRIVIGTGFAADYAALSTHITAAANGDAVISFGSLVITLSGVAPATLTASDFLFA